MTIASNQTTQLLPGLFRGLEEDQRIEVLHIGPALNDTIEFFSGFRCRLQVFDLFAELPLPAQEDTEHGLEQYFAQLLQLPENARYDICLFWDIFNYLEQDSLAAFMRVLQPHLADNCRAHGFSVHNLRTPAANQRYGIAGVNVLSLRERTASLPGYRPHNQNRLREALHCFQMERSVLLSDSRLELLLSAKNRHHASA